MVPLEGYDEIEKRFERMNNCNRSKKLESRNKEKEARKCLPLWNRT